MVCREGTITAVFPLTTVIRIVGISTSEVVFTMDITNRKILEGISEPLSVSKSLSLF